MINQITINMIIELIDNTLELCKEDTLSEDGYRTLIFITNKFNDDNVKKSFILLCIQKGYPKDTGLEVLEILGLN